MNQRVDLLLLLKDHTWDQEGWFLPLAKALEGITARQASWRPPGGGNSIWETLHHLNYYNERYLFRLTGKQPGPEAGSNTATFEVPSAPDAEEAWQAEMERAGQIAEGLRRFLAGLTDETLELRAGLGESMPHSVLHEAYHTGQIMLLRKQQGAWPATRE